MTRRDHRGSTAPLTLTMAARQADGGGQIHRFFPLLQQGFMVRARVGCSIQELLCAQFGLSASYLKERITTVFLNGRAVDDVETSHVFDGATLALSAAMPGLVGATMRRGGFYAAMRGAMTYEEADQVPGEGFGEVRIKLFNLLLSELGPGFLRLGVLLRTVELGAFLDEQASDFWADCRTLSLYERPVTADQLQDGKWLAAVDRVKLSVLFEE